MPQLLSSPTCTLDSINLQFEVEESKNELFDNDVTSQNQKPHNKSIKTKKSTTK